MCIIAVLTLFENELNKPVEKQLEQINLALQNISEWGKRIRNTELLNVILDDADSTTSSTYKTIANLSFNFKNTNPLIRIETNICLNTNGNSTNVAIFIDGQELKKSLSTVNANHMHYLFHQTEINTGNHVLEIKWKTAAGTINKVADGGTNVLVTNLI